MSPPRRPDPFRAPDDLAPVPELDQPRRRVTPKTVDITPPPAAVSVAEPEARRPVKYKRPGTSWVTFVVLGFAAVGMATIGGSGIKKLLSKDSASPSAQTAAPKATSYSTLSKDDAVLVTVAVSPRDARLLLDGEPAVSNPLRLLRSKARHKIAAHAHGYAPVVQEFTADSSKTIHLRLSKR